MECEQSMVVGRRGPHQVSMKRATLLSWMVSAVGARVSTWGPSPSRVVSRKACLTEGGCSSRLLSLAGMIVTCPPPSQLTFSLKLPLGFPSITQARARTHAHTHTHTHTQTHTHAHGKTQVRKRRANERKAKKAHMRSRQWTPVPAPSPPLGISRSAFLPSPSPF